jgi:hypothetical protein
MRRWLEELGPVRPEPSCVVEPDDSAVVRHARPLTPEDAAQLRENAISRMRYDEAAVRSRERRIAIERAPAGKVVHWRAR